MVITIEAHKIAYMALPKAACSTVKLALAQVDPTLPPKLTDKPHRLAKRIHKVYRTRRFRADRWAQFDVGWFRFCVIRDPLSRLISCYKNRVVDKKDLLIARRIMGGEIDLPIDPDPDFFFQNIAVYVASSSVIKHHALPAWMFVGKDLSLYDRVYRMDELDRFTDDLSSITGKPTNLTRENSSSAQLVLDDLMPQTQKVLAKYLSNDYALLKDHYASPF